MHVALDRFAQEFYPNEQATENWPSIRLRRRAAFSYLLDIEPVPSRHFPAPRFFRLAIDARVIVFLRPEFCPCVV
jgi:hypothetical protein